MRGRGGAHSSAASEGRHPAVDGRRLAFGVLANRGRNPDLVILDAEDRERLWCAIGCSRRAPCRRCLEGIRAEALSWLADLADRSTPDHEAAVVSVVPSPSWIRK
ncbi:MAG TPA: hypothetical protein VEN82_05535 [Actinomycetota bacterium]|nr:hypothetical protein [Actinomycetota bacterium]